MKLTLATPNLKLASDVPGLRLRVDTPAPNLLRLMGSGPRGEKGDSPSVSSYKMTNASIVSGVLALDCSEASTFYVQLTENVTSVAFDNWPIDERSQVIKIYFQQDDAGERTVTGWPDASLWPAGFEPQVSSGPGMIDCVVIDSFDGGNTMFCNLVARDYKRKS